MTDCWRCATRCPSQAGATAWTSCPGGWSGSPQTSNSSRHGDRSNLRPCLFVYRLSDIMVPLQYSLNVTLPGDGSTGVHDPFPGLQPTIVKFEDKVHDVGVWWHLKAVIVNFYGRWKFLLLSSGQRKSQFRLVMEGLTFSSASPRFSACSQYNSNMT